LFVFGPQSLPPQTPQQVIDCVSNRSCVAPNGADQSNHRFDQSVFSIVLAKMHIRCHNNWKFNGYLEEDRLHEVAIPNSCQCFPLNHRPSRLIDGTWTTALAGAAQSIALIVAV
jgi:hypothetical protein